jgi:hypothetical protein
MLIAARDLNGRTKRDNNERYPRELGLARTCGLIVLVAASNGHAELLDNWLCHVDSLGIRRVMVAMDKTIAIKTI